MKLFEGEDAAALLVLRAVPDRQRHKGRAKRDDRGQRRREDKAQHHDRPGPQKKQRRAGILARAEEALSPAITTSAIGSYLQRVAGMRHARQLGESPRKAQA